VKLLLSFTVFLIIFLNIGNFLDVTVKPTQSDAIFCLGGIGTDRINTSLDLLENNYSTYNQLYYSTTYGLRNSREDVNATYILYLKNTMAEILYIDNLVKKEKYNSIIIVTDPPHSRRVSFMMQQFTKNLEGKYIIASSHPKWWDTEFYFTNTHALVFSIKELIKILYNYFKYTYKSIFDPHYIEKFEKTIEKNENS